MKTTIHTVSKHSWDRRFFKLAEEVSCWSKDPGAQVGAVIVAPSKREVVIGYNGFVRGAHDDDYSLLTTKEKNELTVHAELNAILNARRPLTGWTLYTTKAACSACALVIIQAGITRVVAPRPEDSAWKASQNSALHLFDTARIQRANVEDIIACV